LTDFRLAGLCLAIVMTLTPAANAADATQDQGRKRIRDLGIAIGTLSPRSGWVDRDRNRHGRVARSARGDHEEIWPLGMSERARVGSGTDRRSSGPVEFSASDFCGARSQRAVELF
jgi:hypothetical protein